MNPDINQLIAYPFEKLAALNSNIAVPADKSAIALSIGEPRHPAPVFVAEEINARINDSVGKYPLSKGLQPLREAIAAWLIQRFNLPESSISADAHVIPVSGTREALFAFAQAVVDRSKDPLVLLPNPFYQIYEGAAFLAGGKPYYLNITSDSNLVPDFDQVNAATWDRCQLLYICSPGNPTGAVINQKRLQKLIELADKHNFIIASDECYSEIYFDEQKAPVGLLETAAKMNRTDYKHCIVFHSLSKRSNVPGLRSGFIAGDKNLVATFLKYRTYHGCITPEFIQHTSARLWQDEQHVIKNREIYREKFAAVIDILSPHIEVLMPEAGFYLWLRTPISDELFSQQLFAQQNVTVLPGSYLSRKLDGVNPGSNYVRIALVAEKQECLEAANRIAAFIKSIE